MKLSDTHQQVRNFLDDSGEHSLLIEQFEQYNVDANLFIEGLQIIKNSGQKEQFKECLDVHIRNEAHVSEFWVSCLINEMLIFTVKTLRELNWAFKTMSYLQARRIPWPQSIYRDLSYHMSICKN